METLAQRAERILGLMIDESKLSEREYNKIDKLLSKSDKSNGAQIEMSSNPQDDLVCDSCQ